MEKRDSFKIGVNTFVISNSKLLLGKRKGVGEGEWGLPGGHLEEWESIEMCAKRELQEETGLMTKSIKFYNVVNDRLKDDGHRIHFGFLVEDFIGNATIMEPDKCHEWNWFDLQNLPEPIFFGHRKQINAFIKSSQGLIDE